MSHVLRFIDGMSLTFLRPLYARENLRPCRRYVVHALSVGRPLFLRLTVLDDQIDDVAELIKHHYKLEELGDPSAVTQVRVFRSCSFLLRFSVWYTFRMM